MPFRMLLKRVKMNKDTINEAEAYRNEIIPLARGKAKQMLEQAIAYKVKLINAAEW